MAHAFDSNHHDKIQNLYRMRMDSKENEKDETTECFRYNKPMQSKLQSWCLRRTVSFKILSGVLRVLQAVVCLFANFLNISEILSQSKKNVCGRMDGMMETNQQAQQTYAKMVEQTSPNSPIWKNCLLAYISGGLICTLGEWLSHLYLAMSFSKDESALLVSTTLIVLSAILTGFGIYGKLGKYCGAGTEVPITGFANSVVSPAIEYRSAGLVLGMAAKMFVLAGPVIVYGTATSVVVGIIYIWMGR